MTEVRKILLMWTVGLALRKNREVEISWGIEKGSVSGDFNDYFMNT